MGHRHKGHDSEHCHFHGKDAIGHVVERLTEGIIASSEGHAVEMPGRIAAGIDAMRTTAMMMLMLWAILERLPISSEQTIPITALFGIGWLLWMMGRSALLGWQHLERLHKVMEEERWEIEHHRSQEREELQELYRAKGFHGELLEEVVDVLMADGDRLLKVMLEEELGLSLETQDHPLLQSFGAAIGSLTSILLCSLALFFLGVTGLMTTALGLMGAAGIANARYEKNRLIPAILWNIGIGAFSFGSLHFLLEYILPYNIF